MHGSGSILHCLKGWFQGSLDAGFFWLMYFLELFSYCPPTLETFKELNCGRAGFWLPVYFYIGTTILLIYKLCLETEKHVFSFYFLESGDPEGQVG